jgi:hypothetical protein
MKARIKSQNIIIELLNVDVTGANSASGFTSDADFARAFNSGTQSSGKELPPMRFVWAFFFFFVRLCGTVSLSH